MKTFTSRTLTTFGITAGLFLLMISGCKPDYPEPELPPQSSMITDFGSFSDGNKTVDSTSHFGYSAVNVGIWNVVLFVNLAVPVAAFSESFNHEPKWNNRSGHYIWQWSKVIGLKKYDAELHGVLEGSYVNWEMRLSEKDGFQDFVWFTGVSASNRLGGRWKLNRSPEAPVPYLQIDWSDDFAGNAWIQYLNVEPGGAENGSYIEYGTDTDPDFDRYYNIYLKSQEKHTNIEWNDATRAGRVQDEVHFGDTLWHCWDGGLLDAGC